MYCENCGAQNDDGQKFCNKCGYPLNNKPEKKIPNIEKIASNDKIPKKLKPVIDQIRVMPKKVLLGAGAGIIILIVLIGFIFNHSRSIDLNKYLKVETSGYNGSGYVEMDVDWPAVEKKYDSKLSYKKRTFWDKLKSLYDGDSTPMEFLEENVQVQVQEENGYFSNGDKISYTWIIDPDAVGTLNYKLKYKNGTVKVSGLEELKKVDAFEDVTVDFEGRETEGTATVNYTGLKVDSGNYECEPTSGLSNGDKVTVTLNDNGVNELRTYGEIPKETEKEFTVSGLESQLEKLDQIDDDSLKRMQQQAEDVYNSYIGQNWGEDSTLESFTYLGDYLLKNKNEEEDYWSSENILYLIYKAEIRSQYINDDPESDQESVDTTNDVYWYISYSDVMLDGNGSLDFDILNYGTPNATARIEEKDCYWDYTGYNSLDDLYKDVVTSNLDTYNHEDNVKAE